MFVKEYHNLRPDTKRMSQFTPGATLVVASLEFM